MLMAASPHSSKLEDILVPGPNITPQQERRNSSSSNNNSNKAANNSQPEQSLKCPRCDSTNTKFCYYNNYSLSQPRYFCKSCRRYWTKGGTLRNVPVGGGLRKNRRPSSSSSSSSSTSKRSSAHIDPQFSAVSAEANSIPLIVNGFHMDLGLSEFRGGPEKRFDVLDHDLSFLGSLGLGVGAASSSSVNIPGFLEYSMMRNGLFHETQHHHSSFENFYQGLNNGATATATATGGTGPKQEMESGLENENRVLWGFPWNGSSDSPRKLIRGDQGMGVLTQQQQIGMGLFIAAL